MANPLTIELHALGQESTDTDGDTVDLGESEQRTAVSLAILVTEVTGDQLTLTLETSADGSAWHEAADFGAWNEPGRRKVYADGLESYVRIVWTVGTTATFRVAGEAYTLYSDQDDLLSALPKDVFDQAEEWVRIKALIDASSILETIVYSAQDVPLTTWTRALRKRCEQIAAGFVQDQHELAGGGVVQVVRDSKAEALAWVEAVRKREIHLPNTSPATEDEVQYSSGSPDTPDTYIDLFSHDFGSF